MFFLDFLIFEPSIVVPCLQTTTREQYDSCNPGIPEKNPRFSLLFLAQTVMMANYDNIAYFLWFMLARPCWICWTKRICLENRSLLTSYPWMMWMKSYKMMVNTCKCWWLPLFSSNVQWQKNTTFAQPAPHAASLLFSGHCFLVSSWSANQMESAVELGIPAMCLALKISAEVAKLSVFFSPLSATMNLSF